MARRRSSYGSYGWGWGYFKHTTTAEIESSSRKALADAKKKGLTYHPVTIRGNKIATTWWGKSWCENLERYADYENRLPRGRTYVRHNAVVDLEIEKGVVQAKVQGSSLYKVEVRFTPLDPKLEKELGKVCSEQIQHVEELVSGKFPETLKERFLARGGLFPTPREIHFKCSCPDWASMCKHVAAVMYGIGARLDEEPLKFFDLRGIRTDDFVAKAVENKVESMLSHAAGHSDRIIGDDQLEALFGMEIGGPMHPAPESPVRRRGRPPKTSNPASQPAKTMTRSTGEQIPARRRGRPPKRPPTGDRRENIRMAIQRAGYPERTKRNLTLLADSLQEGEVFGNARVTQILDCSAPTATACLKKLYEELNLIVPVEGQGKGKYRFR